MKERPILFSGPMVQAILDGRKTQTRRVMKRQPLAKFWKPYACPDGRWNWVVNTTGMGSGDPFSCPYGKPGDRLWVRETWAETTNVERISDWPNRQHIPGERSDDEFGYLFDAIIYRADGDWEWCDADGSYTERSYWKPSIHMPRKYCRLLLDVKAIRVERLQDIKPYEIQSDGFAPPGPSLSPAEDEYWRPKFAQFWNSLNEKRGFGWATNPWVWIIEFERE